MCADVKKYGTPNHCSPAYPGWSAKLHSGKIGGAKGVWIVDKDDTSQAGKAGRIWIEVSSASQLKINQALEDLVVPLINACGNVRLLNTRGPYRKRSLASNL
ncbi:hypothetical protein BDV29DRAFT_108581 [Aspergillus leporis]|jgi:hypothetical protein|uniref:Uncharacterized protein n=1 Tax=Aspergillus leporis TaxID=41062 RepID=A0A5N5X414_9EURO|nr:hypothetical protein BDV29DRAFT_108581 [Aspergillus leporis]